MALSTIGTASIADDAVTSAKLDTKTTATAAADDATALSIALG